MNVKAIGRTPPVKGDQGETWLEVDGEQVGIRDDGQLLDADGCPSIGHSPAYAAMVTAAVIHRLIELAAGAAAREAHAQGARPPLAGADTCAGGDWDTLINLVGSYGLSVNDTHLRAWDIAFRAEFGGQS